jgi:hypothetical protein
MNRIITTIIIAFAFLCVITKSEEQSCPKIKITYEWESARFSGPTTIKSAGFGGGYDCVGTYKLSGKWKKFENGKRAGSVYCIDIDNVNIWGANDASKSGTNPAVIKWNTQYKLGFNTLTPSSSSVSSLRDNEHTYNSPDGNESITGDQQNKNVTFVP